MTSSGPAGYVLHTIGTSFAPEGPEVLRGISLTIEAGTYVAVVGPNGAGKSTFLQVLAGIHTPRRGRITLDGKELAQYGRKALARRIAWLPQRLTIGFEITVADFVALGRTPHSSMWGSVTPHDQWVVDDALALTSTTAYRSRLMQELSGGEQQRVALAMALAQEPDILLLDEPSSHLDAAHALSLLDVVTDRQVANGLTVVAVFHDLNLAALAAARVIVLADGVVVADGATSATLTPAVLARVFGPVMHSLMHPTALARGTQVAQVLPARAPGRPVSISE